MRIIFINRKVTKFLTKIRAVIVNKLKPAGSYMLFSKEKRSVKPISTKYGFDRGKPIDRYYIEKFLEENKRLIKGNCLEVTDNEYTVKYGGKNVTSSDVLDVDINNKDANIHGDLRNLVDIKRETYDTLIMTQVFVMIDDYEAAIKECWRILKPGGAILVTMPCLSPVWNIKNHHWRWTGASASYLFNKLFPHNTLEVKTYGNTLIGQAYWVGMAIEDLKKEELEYNDPYFPVTVSIMAIKESKKLAEPEN